jgi:thiamine-monophosphate kinase
MSEKEPHKPKPEGEKLTPVSELGEFGLIDHLTRNIRIQHPETLAGVGDDAAVIDAGNKVILLSTDLMVEGIHFDMVYTPLRHLGYKSVVVNVSDIAAMNGTPRQMTISFAISSRFSVEALDEIYEGILLACTNYKVDLVGGDTSSSNKGLLISGAILGEAKKDEVVYRKGAGPGDLLCVTGDLGSAYLGLLVLEREKKVFEATPGIQPDLHGFDYQIGRLLKPEARTDIRNLLLGMRIQPTSMIDISDGLASDVLHLCKHSGTGVKIFEEKIPIDESTRRMAFDFNIIPTVAALSGGEDYELLFTVRQSEYEKIKDFAGVTIIGHMTPQEEGKWLITPEGKKVKLIAQGWDSFK